MLMVIWSVVRLIFWMIVVPFFIGQLFNFILPRERKSVGFTYLLGLLIYLAVFEVMAIPCMLLIKYNAFRYCRWIYGVVSLVMAALGAFRFDRSLFTEKKSGFQNMKLDTKIYFGIYIALVLFQMIQSLRYAPFDGDDAYYVVQSLQAQQADVMNTIDPYIGRSAPLDVRHALAAITMWIAFIAKVSGVHATIVSHVVMPLFIIPLVYFVYYEIGKLLFKDKKELLPIFMIFINLLMIFGNVSISTPATFLLMRSGQGKTVLCGLVLPLIILVFLLMFEDVSKVKEQAAGLKEKAIVTAPWWIMLTLVNILGCACTELGVVLTGGLSALLTLTLLIVSKRWTAILGAFASVIPSFIYVAIYFLVK